MLKFSSDNLLDESAEFNDLSREASFNLPTPRKTGPLGILQTPLRFDDPIVPLDEPPVVSAPEKETVSSSPTPEPTPESVSTLVAPETPMKESPQVEEPVMQTPQAGVKEGGVRVTAEVERITVSRT